MFTGASNTIIFSIGSESGFKALSTFSPEEGGELSGPLYPASNGYLYGANTAGNGSVTGSIFLSSTGGTIHLIKSSPYEASSLIEASDGNLYGAAAAAPGGNFAVYRMTEAGSISTLLSLGANAEVAGPLLQASDGNFYGTTNPTGSSGGVLFRVSPSGKYDQLVQFPSYQRGRGGLIQASNGMIYGITVGFKTPCPREIGTIFSLSLSGEYKTIYNFGTSCYPVYSGATAGVVDGGDGYLYGVTGLGGNFGDGSIFKVALDGSGFTTLFSFGPGGGPLSPGGFGPSFVLGSDGAFYGTSPSGGAYQLGTVYRFDAGLAPPLPVAQYFRPASGPAGTKVIIAGSNLIGLKAVSFNGIPATQISSRGVDYAIAVVPPGATTGPVTVTTGNGSAVSTVDFTVE